MGSWNYRAMKDEQVFTIHEVYYGENGELEGYTEKPISAIGESLDELEADLRKMLNALRQKPLTREDFKRADGHG